MPFANVTGECFQTMSSTQSILLHFFSSLDIVQTWKILVEAVLTAQRKSMFVTSVDVIMSVSLISWNLN